MKEIATAIVAVMSEVHGVQQTGKNDFQKYSYASEVDLLRALRPAMVRNGLSLVPINFDRTDTPITKKDGSPGGSQCDLTANFLLMHTSGETLTLAAAGSGADTGDKGVYKALTGALKYLVRQVFLVPTGTDPEIAMSEEELAEKAEAERKAKHHEKAEAERKAKHHPTWDADRNRFFASLKAGGVEKTYDEIKELCTKRNRPKPSEMAQEQREQLEKYLITTFGKAPAQPAA